MLDWKDTLRLLAILIAWGVAGHFDYEDAVALEEVKRAHAMQRCVEPDTPYPRDTAARATVLTGAAPNTSAWPCSTDDE